MRILEVREHGGGERGREGRRRGEPSEQSRSKGEQPIDLLLAVGPWALVGPDHRAAGTLPEATD